MTSIHMPVEHEGKSPPSKATRRGSLLSVIVPCFNEEQVIAETHRRLINTLDPAIGMNLEILFVDDGSRDHTLDRLREIHAIDRRVSIIGLSRNFGHQIAVTAGMEAAKGDILVLIDADLQDPPEIILAMLDQWRDGVDVVYGVRTAREGESAFKRWTAKTFYRLINYLSDTEIPFDTGDFRLMDRRVVSALLLMPERDRFVRGMVAWVGFRQAPVFYPRVARWAGDTKYPFKQMLRFATDGILSFSIRPLQLASYMGFTVSGLALLGIIYALVLRLFTLTWITGWTLLFIAVLFLGGVQLICLGIIGEYLGRVYGEVKRRPLYLISEKLDRDADSSATPAQNTLR